MSCLKAAVFFLLPGLLFAIGGRGPLEGDYKQGLKNERPAYMDRVGVDEKMGENVDLSLRFSNEEGELITLGSLVKEKPVFLMLVYYTCPTLCSTHLNSMMSTLNDSSMKVGKDFDVVAISIDPTENSKVASEKKKEFMKHSKLDPKAVHFLTGEKEEIAKIADQVGFRYAWDANMKQWAHTAVSYVLTPKGKISYYHYGLRIVPKVLRLSLVEASDNKIGNIVDRVMLFCLQYDPNKKTYAFYAYNIMRFAAVLTVLILGFFLGRFWWKQKRAK